MNNNIGLNNELAELFAVFLDSKVQAAIPFALVEISLEGDHVWQVRSSATHHTRS